ncbi:Carbon catabolite repressor protein 4 homolog 1 (CCR4 homolog 1) [Durusdinium trenchii]|uniref:Carbon catabolite repressor protein 4 homolog 1 (CCR4 homolog 1) n=1 Tax=Durusdinium trenchii TaxID=1381693 RepID=A0ABP0RQI2_9DINO
MPRSPTMDQIDRRAAARHGHVEGFLLVFTQLEPHLNGSPRWVKQDAAWRQGRRWVTTHPARGRNANASGKSLRRLRSKKSVGAKGKGPARDLALRVASYNVLAQTKLKGPQYAYCKARDINWHQRRQVLLDEILAFEADILCLQEVDHFEDWWQPRLGEAGYDGTFQKRGRRHREGVATFFLRSKFQVFCTEALDFNKVGRFLGEPSPSSRLEQDNCGLLVAIQPWEDSTLPSAVVVSNVQLVCPRTDDLVEVQRKQVLMLVRSIERFNADFHLPVVVAGSFNFLPQDENYHILVKGCLRPRLSPPFPLDARPTAQALGQTHIRVTWPATPRSGDAKIQGFLVRKRVGGNKAMGFVDPVFFPGHDRLEAVVGGLGAGLTYEFIVAAVSAVGSGEFSKPSVPVRTLQHPVNTPEERVLLHPTKADSLVVDEPVETLNDWLGLSLEDPNVHSKEALLKDHALAPRFEDKELNLVVNPTRSRPGGARNDKLVHTLGLQSAFGQCDGGTEPQFTLNSERFRGCVDYIFFSQGSLAIKELLTLPTATSADRRLARLVSPWLGRG